MKKVFKIVFLILFIVMIFTYRSFLIRITINKYLKENNINGYSIVNIEKFSAQDGYLIHLKNDSGKERNITVISKMLPINVIHDSMINKEEMK